MFVMMVFTTSLAVIVVSMFMSGASSAATALLRLFVMTATSATASATFGLLPTTTSLLFPDENNFESDLLKCQLITGASQKLHGAARRCVSRTQLDPHRFSRKMGKSFLHLSIENEGDIGVEFLLKLVELLLSMLPRAGLKHRQHENILPRIVGKGVEHAGPLDPRSGRRRIFVTQIFADGNHT